MPTKPTTKPTPKLPRARVMYYYLDFYKASNMYVAPGEKGDGPIAVIPCHTIPQAKRIVKMAPFLGMTEEEQLAVLAKHLWESIYSKDGKPSYRVQFNIPIPPDYYRQAGAILRAMTQPKGRGEA